MRRIALGPELGDRESGGSRQNLRLFLGGPCREALRAVRGGEKVRNIEVRPASPGCSFTLGDSSIVFAKQQMRLTTDSDGPPRSGWVHRDRLSDQRHRL